MNRLFKVSLICAGLAFSYGFFLAYPIYHAINVGQKMVAEAIPFSQHPQHPDKYILVAGDSTAVGVGAIDPKESIAGRLGQEFPHADITNLGISGARLKNLLLVLHQQKKKHFDLIVLQIGANDITNFTPYETIKSEISEILLLCNGLSGKTILLTAGNIGNAHVFHWPLSNIITARTLAVRTIFIDEAAKYKSVYYIDLFKSKRDDPFEKDIKRYYAPDLFHLTGEGYGLWFLSVQKAL